jgi:hypothetical protein
MKNLNESLLESIELIEESVLESEIDVLVSIGDEYAKIGMLMEYADEATLDEFQIIQEADYVVVDGKTADEANKKKETDDSNDKGFLAKLKKVAKWFIETLTKIGKFIEDAETKLMKAIVKGWRKVTNHTVKNADGTEFKSNDLYKVAEDMNAKYTEVWFAYVEKLGVKLTDAEKKDIKTYGSESFKFNMKDASLMVRLYSINEKQIKKIDTMKNKIKEKSSNKQISGELKKLTNTSVIDMFYDKWVKCDENVESKFVKFDTDECRKAVNEIGEALSKNTVLTPEEKNDIVSSFYKNFATKLSNAWGVVRNDYNQKKAFVIKYFERFGYSAAEAE